MSNVLLKCRAIKDQKKDKENVVCITALKRWVTVGIVIAGLLAVPGCAGLIMREAMKGSGGNYSKLKPSMSPPPAGMGRLFIYMVGGGPNIINTTGLQDTCTVDDIGYPIMGKTFWYVDLPSGPHKVTSTDVTNYWGTQVRYGKKSVEFTLSQGETKFCRMNYIASKPGKRELTPSIVGSAEAEQELAKLDFYKNYNKYKRRILI